jgi:hypothetical protein
LKSEKLVRTLTFPGIAPQFIAFSPDSRTAAVTWSSGIILYDVESLAVVGEITDRACNVAFAGPSRLIAICEKSLLVYEIQPR